MPASPRPFKTWSITLPRTERLPAGRARATIADRRSWSRLRSPVQSVHISIPARGDAVARTATFDGERVIVEYDAEGEIMGLELLSCVPLSRTPEIRRALGRRNHPVLLCAAYYTAHHLWHDLVLALRVAAEAGMKDPQPRMLRKANPESSLWQEDPRGEPLACGA